MKTYDDQFKLRIVQQKNAGKSVTDLCEEFDLKSQTMYVWTKKNNAPSEKQKRDESPLSDIELELIELKEQLKQLEMENDILKQAALIIGKR